MSFPDRRQLSNPDSEHARIKKLASYFGSLGIVPKTSGSRASQPIPSTPTLASDATLTALAQLGPLRLRCDRAFVSLIDRSHQYVVAEATRSLAFSDPTTSKLDRLYLGVTTLDFGWGVCTGTIHVFTDPTGQSDICTPNVQADRSRFRIRDLHADAHYAARPYVTGWPHIRTYLEVPLCTSTGEVIGSYCVVDTRLRPDWDYDLAVQILTDVARTIMDHIELVKMREQHHRLERLVNSLCVYVGESTSMHAHDPHDTGSGSSDLPSDDNDNQIPFSELGTCPDPQSASSSDESLDTQITTPSPPPRPDPFMAVQTMPGMPTRTLSQNSTSSSSRPPHTHMSREIPDTFRRASELIQEATDIEGIVFLDASPNGFATRLDSKGEGSPASLSSACSLDSLESKTPVVKMCEVLGLSVNGATGASPDDFTIPEQLLQRLLHAHACGTSFSADELDEHESQECSDVSQMFRLFSSARSILFMPLWDYRREGWYAAAIGWSTKANRIFAPEDLVYISAFGNSIMNEVSRIEAMSVSHAKSNFISSISHELRSPLHGILASIELLKQTDLDPERLPLAEMIEVCGTTLLETMDHLLDFAKINHLYRRGRSRSGDGDSRKNHPNICSTVDLSTLLQEVVEGAYLGHSAQNVAQFVETGVAPLHGAKRTVDRTVGEFHIPRSRPVLLTMDIESRDDWRLYTEPGAWRRIVLNLVGNALKYTDRGSIEVGLKCVDAGQEFLLSNGVPERRYICLSVKDTGRGIGEDYLKHRLFTPYAQEDSLVSGTGLGLSIVHHLVTHLDGKVDIQSAVGVGTLVQVMIPVPVDGEDAFLGRKPDSFEAAGAAGGEMHGRSVVTSTRGSLSEPDEGETALLSNAVRTARSWLGMNIASEDGANDTDAPADFCMLRLSQLQDAHDRGALKDTGASLIVICARPPTGQQYRVAALYAATFLQQPFGPKKLRSSLETALSRREQQSPSSDQAPIRDPGTTPLAIGAPVTATSTQPSSPVPIRSLSSSPSIGSPSPSQSPAAVAAPYTPPLKVEGGSRPLHLLLVDDNDINLKILIKFARRLGCTFEAVTNGREAVDAFTRASSSPASTPFDVVLMDVNMPEMNGFQATKAIRKWEQEQGQLQRESAAQSQRTRDARCRVLALTGLGSADSQREAFSSGVDEFLVKPVLLGRLKGVLFGERGGKEAVVGVGS